MVPLVAMIKEMESRVQELAAELLRIRRHAHALEEENTKLRRQLSRVYDLSEDAGKDGQTRVDGINNLWKLYEEGFHVCNVYFGRTRGPDCLFCAALLNRDKGEK